MKVIGTLILIPSYIGLGLAVFLIVVGFSGSGPMTEGGIFAFVFAQAVGAPSLIGIIIGHILLGSKSKPKTLSKNPPKTPSRPSPKTPQSTPSQPIYSYEDLYVDLIERLRVKPIEKGEGQAGYLLLFPLTFVVLVVVMVYLCKFLMQVLY